jgi:SAM-dependent methyltransferase
MSTFSPKEYWTGLAESDRSGDPTGFSPVLHPDAPAWFNRLIDELQFRALRRALALARIAPGSLALDVGCGTGRWVRRYEGMGFRATGVDATGGMLRLARELRTTAPLVVGEAYRLPFLDARFDLVSDITVVQHIAASLQPQAISEMVRVARPGGCLILMELIRGEGPLLFPREPRDWIEQAASCGAKLVGWFGQEYRLFDRLFVSVALTLAGRNRSPAKASSGSPKRLPKPSVAAHRIYWRIRRVTVPISVWADPIADRICPAHFATHGVFVFRK